MKKFIFFIAMLAVTLLASCGTDNPPVEISNFKINKRSITLEEGETYKLKAVFTPQEAADLFADKVVWESSKEKIAKVDDEGNVKALKAGECVITATCEGFEAKCEVTVEEPDLYPDVTISLSEDEIEVPSVGGEYTITVTSSDSWTASSSDSWVTVTPASGEGADDIVIIKVLKSIESEDTEAIVSFKNSRKTANLKIYRAGLEPFTFSVSSTKKVMFSPGNLLKNDGDNPTAFEFAQPQYYDYSTVGRLQTFTFEEFDYSTLKIANNPKTDAKWRVLTRDEWDYLFNDRENAAKLNRRIRISGIEGLCILPDNFEYPASVSDIYNGSSVTSYNETDWKKMEGNGAIFLPAIGIGGKENVYLAVYWTSTALDKDNGICVGLYGTLMGGGYNSSAKTGRLGVRLAYDAK